MELSPAGVAKSEDVVVAAEEGNARGRARSNSGASSNGGAGNSLSFREPAPSTLLYRSGAEGSRFTMSKLLDMKRMFAENLKSDDGSDDANGDIENTGAALGGDAEMDSYFRTNRDFVSTSAVAKPEAKVRTLTWFNGVMVPCLLNIWGVIMFLRLGWVVGQAGLWGASLIVTGSNVVTTITALSLCAICTNGEVEGGGAYYLISRSLGPVFGGTIGILFFIAQAVATSMYVIGFAESIVDMLDEPFTGTIDNDVRIIGLGTSLLLLCVALIGVSWYAKCQIGLLVALVTAMVAVTVGSALPDTPSTTENADAGFTGYEWRNDGAEYSVDPTLPTVTQSFFTVFSVFFPAVTGIMAGATCLGI